MPDNEERIPKSLPYGILLTLPALYATSIYSYLLFHCLVEMFSVVIACGIFMIAWNSRRFSNNGYLLFLGIAYLFVGCDDLLHTLAYKGMNVFPHQDANLPTQLWIVARYTESLSLLIAPIYLSGRKIHPVRVAGIYALVTLLLQGAIFFLPLFPDCYLDGSGLTSFKRFSEGVICLVLIGAMFHLFHYRRQFSPDILRLLMLSIFMTIAAEMAFIWYVGVYDISNMIGHFFKYLSFYLLYVAMIRLSLVRPYDVLFNDLKQREAGLAATNAELQNEIERRKRTEDRLREINADLTNMKEALEEQLNAALIKRNELTQKLSELVLMKADHTQNHEEMFQKLRLAEIENRELRKQLSHYFEALKQANQDIAGIYSE